MCPRKACIPTTPKRFAVSSHKPFFLALQHTPHTRTLRSGAFVVLQTVLDPTNVRPILGVLLVGCIMGTLAYFSHGLSVTEATAVRRAVYAAKGTFLTEVAVKDAPQDVRRRGSVSTSVPSAAVGAGLAPARRRSTQASNPRAPPTSSSPNR